MLGSRPRTIRRRERHKGGVSRRLAGVTGGDPRQFHRDVWLHSAPELRLSAHANELGKGADGLPAGRGDLKTASLAWQA